MAEYEYHLPVMQEEILRSLISSEQGTYVDCTLGGGGHAEILLKGHPGISLVGIDCDENAIMHCKNKLDTYGNRIRLARENYSEINAVFASLKITAVDGFLLDLGISSRQIDDKERGFSFHSASLDMRMDGRSKVTAADILNSAGRERLSEIFFEFGEERMADAISARIIEERKNSRIDSGPQLSQLVSKVIRRYGKINPATKIFQALRIAVNNELENLSVFLNAFPSLLKPGGRIAVLTYHSLEDRIVKRKFKELEGHGLIRLMNKKVLRPSFMETKINPRSRSAKLRTAEKL
ncbi:MAG: 16S rRNA (cytosine(1402)-N(4))-methyltransferase RsmH [Elusimicrobiota bacterium]